MAKTMLMGAAALTAIRLTDGRRANIPAGRAVPENIDPADAERLLDEGFLVRIELLDDVLDIDPDVLEPEGPTPPATRTTIPAGLTADGRLTDGSTPPPAGDPDDVDELPTEPFTEDELAALPTTVDALLDEVGDNPVKAQQVLDLEREKPTEGNGKQRASLINGLQDVIDAAAADDEEQS